MQIRAGDNSQSLIVHRVDLASRVASRRATAKKNRKGRGKRRDDEHLPNDHLVSPIRVLFRRFRFPWESFVLYRVRPPPIRHELRTAR